MPTTNSVLPPPTAEIIARDNHFADSLSRSLLYAITDSIKYTQIVLSFDDKNKGFIKVKNDSPRIEGFYTYQPITLNLKYDQQEEIYQLQPDKIEPGSYGSNTKETS